MNRLSLKTLLITGFALCLVGGVIGCRQKRETVQQSKHYPHEHLQASAFEPLAKLQTVEYKLREGETLANVARLRYGHQNYYRVIKVYNHIEDETQVAPNLNLRLPDISVILADEGLTKVVPQEVNLILCARAKYDKIVAQLWALPRGTKSIPENLKQELFEAADDLQQAIESLKVIKPGVSAVPLRTLGQLEQCMEGMRGLTEQLDSYGYDIDIVQQRFALALAYAIIWARDGFK
jgi:hypothetical protein